MLNSDDVQTLSAKVQETKFIDAKGSHSDAALMGPPVLEYSAFNRIPTSKPRKDARQGTIDSDPDYQDFLMSLTNAPVKLPPVDSSSLQESKSDEAYITPLVQHIKDKKANKNKEPTTPAKVIKSRERKESKDSSASEKKAVAKSIKEGAKSDKRGSIKVEKHGRENRKASALTNSSSSSGGKADTSSAPSPASSASQGTGSQGSQDSTKSTKPERKRERGSASAAAKILQRDLGLVPGTPGRKKKEAVSTTNSNTATSSTMKPADTAQNPKPLVILPPKQPAVTATGTVTSPTEPGAPTAAKAQGKLQSGASKGRGGKAKATVAPSPAPAPTGTQAFLKHANPSQGITEPLLEEAFMVYGAVTKVEIDKKKGFAYIDFAENEGLRMAIAASPITVAQGQVVVLECKTGASLQNRNIRGGGGSANTPPAQAGRGGAGGRRHRGVRGGGGKAAQALAVGASTGEVTPTITSPAVPQESTMAPSAPTEAASG